MTLKRNNSYSPNVWLRKPPPACPEARGGYFWGSVRNAQRAFWTESFLLVRAQRSPFLCPLIRIRRRQDMGNACTRFRHVAISKGPFHEVLRLSRLWLHLVVGHHRLVLLFYYDLIVIHRLSKDSGNTTYFLQFFHKCFVSLCHQHVIFILHG